MLEFFVTIGAYVLSVGLFLGVQLGGVIWLGLHRKKNGEDNLWRAVLVLWIVMQIWLGRLLLPMIRITIDQWS